MRKFLFLSLILLILLSGCISIEDILKIIFPSPPEELCGNGVVDPDENCSSCPEDVQCEDDEECVEGVCAIIELCGNGTIDEGENCLTCPSDVQCEENEDCIQGVCEEIELCGNGTIDEGENCENCQDDVQCAEGEECIEGVCAIIELCGNGAVDEGENCENCPEDVQCAEDEECVNGNCVKIAGPGVSEVELRVNTVEHYLKVGQGVRVDGAYEYSGQSFDIKLDDVVKMGYLQYKARFKMYDSEGNLVATRAIQSETELEFYDSEGKEIRVDAYIYLENILIHA